MLSDATCLGFWLFLLQDDVWPCGGLVSCYFSCFLLSYVVSVFFFFSSRRRHTRLVSDWSSDVCSSDLGAPRSRCRRTSPSSSPIKPSSKRSSIARWSSTRHSVPAPFTIFSSPTRWPGKIGRASCRERV